VAGIIVCCVLGLVSGFFVLGGVVAVGQGQTQTVPATCGFGVLAALLTFALVSLFQAAKNSGQLNAYRMGYQAQMQQYHQNAQRYAAGQQPSQQPQSWQQQGPGQQWGQPAWPPQPQQPPPPPQQNWPPPPPPPSNPT